MQNIESFAHLWNLRANWLVKATREVESMVSKLYQVWSYFPVFLGLDLQTTIVDSLILLSAKLGF